MDTIEAIRTRRSIRSFRSDPVEHGLIAEIIADAAQAPPPFAGQVPWSFSVLEGAERIAALGERALVYARENRPDGPGYDWTRREGFKAFWNAPVVIVIAGPVQDCCRAGQNLMLSAHARGLGTCWVGAPMMWLGTAEGKSAFAIPEGLEAGAVLCLGYADNIPAAPVHASPKINWLG
jgi:nitroreductase